MLENFVVDSVRSSNRIIWLDYIKENKIGETMTVCLSRCENPHTQNSLPRLWKELGKTETELETWWNLDVYVTYEALCIGKYNPQEKRYLKYNRKGKLVKNCGLNVYEWILEATKENAIKLLQECERRFLNCIPTETVVESEEE